MARNSAVRSREANRANHHGFAELSKLLKSGRAVALIGAGVSARANYPTWSELLAKFEKRLSDRGAWQEGEREFVERERDPLWRAQEYRARLPAKDFNSIVRKTFVAPKRLVVDDFFKALMRLPFRHVLTTNYDDLLETLHRRLRRREPFEALGWEESDRLTRFITSLGNSRAKRHYVHLHGRLLARKKEKPARRSGSMGEIVLTETDYVRRYVTSEAARKKLFAIFATQRIVFIGFSVDDPELNQILREVNAFLTSSSPCHFALLPLRAGDDAPELLRRRFRLRYGIEPIFFPVTAGNFEPLTKVLTALVRGSMAGLPRITGKYANIKPVKEEGLAATQKARPKRRKIDPDDPQKLGDPAEANGRRLTAKVKSIGGGWYSLTLRVEPLPGSEPLQGPVRFHLHPTFEETVQSGDRQPDGTYLLELPT
ncbi:MAG TPA: SIR2 family protein, partial [Chthoniobacterales bacterium]|nr:SIR2 family protein [Chthoniobacterales bacterium]